MRIHRVVIFCSPNDIHLAELCAASVRYWNQTIPLFLHKDESRHSFSTSKLEKGLNVGICDSSNSSVGNPLSKFFYVTRGADIIRGENILVLDADTAWYGNIAELLEPIPEECELIVQGQEASKAWLKKQFFDPDFFETMYPGYSLPKFGFNSGHFLIKVGSIEFDESEGLLTEDKLDTVDGLFPYDQGLFNFIHAKRQSENSIKALSVEFAKWSGHEIDFDNCEKEPFIIHWAGRAYRPEEKLDYWQNLVHYRNYFLVNTTSPMGRFIFVCGRRFRLSVYYLKQIRLLLLGKGSLVKW